MILDAHKLISEKDDELSTLSGELEGNRKLVEKLEGQVLQGRTKVAPYVAVLLPTQSLTITFDLAFDVVQ